MYQVKTFIEYSNDPKGLDEEINAWLSENEKVVEIKNMVSTAVGKYDLIYSSLSIMYEVRPSLESEEDDEISQETESSGSY